MDLINPEKLRASEHPASPETPSAAAGPARVDTNNNFDLLRLLASLQVVYFHTTHHLRADFSETGKALNKVIDFFPGVPIFFVISGFLISRSYERSSSVRSYARNRLLRIYPALWVSFAVSLALLGAVGVLRASFVETLAFPAWVAAQLTVGQFYHPGYLRSFGVGVLNGSLWTIPVELGFYVLLPLVYGVLRRLPAKAGNAFLGGLAVASYSIGYAATHHAGHDSILWLKLLLVSPVPYFYMFLFGVLMHRSFAQMRRFFHGKALRWAAGYVGSMLAVSAYMGDGWKTNYVFALLANVCLACLTISFAFSWTTLSERLLRGNDISYGLYIYHMLVVNLLVHEGLIGELRYAFFAAAISLAIATLSWRLVESPALKLKGSGRARAAAHASTGGEGAPVLR